jgi:hypothetical protein
MSKPLYEEALADVRSLREVAEDNAKRAVTEALVPRIRDLIEQQLLGEDAPFDQTEEELLGLSGEELTSEPRDPLDPTAVRASPRADPTGQSSGGAATVASAPVAVDTQEPVAISLETDPVQPVCPPEGCDDEDEFVLDVDSIEKLTPVVEAAQGGKDLAADVARLEAQFVALGVTRKMRGTKIEESITRIERLLTRVEDTYDHVQESTLKSEHKNLFEGRLERLFRDLSKMKKESKKMRRLREADEDLDLDLGGDEGGDELDLSGEEGAEDVSGVTLGLDVHGLKVGEDGEIDLSDVSVELEKDDGAGEEELDLGVEDDVGDELDLGGDEGGDDLDLQDENAMVEIDEAMLVRELKRMRKINEAEAVPSTKGTKPAAKEFDDFGDAKDEGEPLDQKITTESEKREEDEDEDPQVEACNESLAKETRLQSNMKARMRRLYTEGHKCQGARRQLYKEAWLRAKKSLAESRVRSEKISKRLNEAKKSARSNIGAQRQAEQRVAEASLRRKLAEQNLLNAKLIYTNKLLQNESLSARQKAAIIEKLDEVKSVREAKLVYESLTKTLAKHEDKKLTESRVVGSSSQATRPASTQQLNESFEADRWARLAGIK